MRVPSGMNDRTPPRRIPPSAGEAGEADGNRRLLINAHSISARRLRRPAARAMGRTRNGSTYVPQQQLKPSSGSTSEDGGSEAPGFWTAVESPPLATVPHQRLSSSTVSWSSAFGGPSRRTLLELIVETLCGSRHCEGSETQINGAAEAALFLGKLCMTSGAMRQHAGANALWYPLMQLSFGPDAACQLSGPLPCCGTHSAMTTYVKLVHEMATAPSMFARSIIVQRGSTRALTYDYDHSGPGKLSFRALSSTELSRIALWSSKYKLAEETCSSPGTLTISAACGTLSFESMLAMLRQTVPSLRARSFCSPSYSLPSDSHPRMLPYVTVSQLLASIEEFEASLSAESLRAWTLADITVPWSRVLLPMRLVRQEMTHDDDGGSSSMEVDDADDDLSTPWLMLCWRQVASYRRPEHTRR
jgi:hypothetical protein